MKNISLICCCALYSVAAITVQSASADTRSYCADKWPDDYRMQEYCLNKQAEAHKQMREFADANNLLDETATVSPSSDSGVAAVILHKCMTKWKHEKFSTYDYRMVMYCANKQVNSYNRLNSANIPTDNSGRIQRSHAPRTNQTVTVKARPNEKADCVQARQHLEDLKGAGLSGTQQYNNAKAAVAECIR